MTTVQTFDMFWGFLLMIFIGGQEGLTYSTMVLWLSSDGFQKVYFAPNVWDFGLVVWKAKLFHYSCMTTERMSSMCYGSMPIFIGAGGKIYGFNNGPYHMSHIFMNFLIHLFRDSVVSRTRRQRRLNSWSWKNSRQGHSLLSRNLLPPRTLPTKNG